MQKYDVAQDLDDLGLLREVAAILAVGILRLHARAALPRTDPAEKNLPKSIHNGLELPSKTVLHGHTG